MLRRHLLLAALAAALPLPATADERDLTAAEIDALLSGNTAVGEWGGTPYRQHFAADGRTVYIAEGRPPSPGRWRTDAEAGTYESWWEQTGWTSYRVTTDGETHYWLDGTGSHAFTVEEGDTTQ